MLNAFVYSQINTFEDADLSPEKLYMRDGIRAFFQFDSIIVYAS